MSNIKISIVSSSEEIYSGEATMVFATGSLGELGIAPGHTPLLTGLAAGPVRVQNGSEEETFFCSGGFIEVQPNAVTILSDTAERADSLDESEALKAKEAAEQSLADQQSTIDYTKAAAQLAEAVARLKTIQKLRKNI
ncbi:F0F1 ATP synthase subunit epsilon [Gammaproteobacteria bacterium]|nr:F0F1 ATP synthase subunit epsilon [Gammaproteobacteria bacterium]|tara:strand:+ start:177 stop:590 length:414 start_codon:yes stop_codon:yes gene_type:complete